MDHCFHGQAWPCGDLWNTSAVASVGEPEQEKRDRMPSEDLLRRAREPFLDVAPPRPVKARSGSSGLVRRRGQGQPARPRRGTGRPEPGRRFLHDGAATPAAQARAAGSGVGRMTRLPPTYAGDLDISSALLGRLRLVPSAGLAGQSVRVDRTESLHAVLRTNCFAALAVGERNPNCPISPRRRRPGGEPLRSVETVRRPCRWTANETSA